MENINNATVEELMERRAAILEGLDNVADDELEALEKEVRAIADELESRKAAEAARESIRNQIASGEAGVVVETIKTEDHIMSNEEVRKGQAYIEAYANYIKSGNDAECRALLTENVSGTVPVPVMVEGIIAEELRASKIMSRVRKSYAKANVKVGFEVSAPIAQFHEEGDDPIAEEDLQLGIVTLVAETLKKWVSISSEALDTMAGESLLRYVYEEIGRKIIEAEEKAVVDAILAAPAAATPTAPAVADSSVASRGITDFIDARALVSTAASDLVAIMSPTLYAEYRGLALAANFQFDVFDGMEVILNDYATDPIIGDLRGILANYPAGDAITYLFDDKTLMTSDLVRVLGRKPVAVAVVGNNYFAKITEE